MAYGPGRPLSQDEIDEVAQAEIADVSLSGDLSKAELAEFEQIIREEMRLWTYREYRIYFGLGDPLAN